MKFLQISSNSGLDGAELLPKNKKLLKKQRLYQCECKTYVGCAARIMFNSPFYVFLAVSWIVFLVDMFLNFPSVFLVFCSFFLVFFVFFPDFS